MTSHRSLSAQIEEVEYELAMRRKVYPRLDGRKAREAEEHMLRMECVLATLRGLLAHRTRGAI